MVAGLLLRALFAFFMVILLKQIVFSACKGRSIVSEWVGVYSNKITCFLNYKIISSMILDPYYSTSSTPRTGSTMPLVKLMQHMQQVVLDTSILLV